MAYSITNLRAKIWELQNPLYIAPDVPFEKFWIYFKGEGIQDERGKQINQRFVFALDPTLI